MVNKKILIMAGGTGGHVFPALAVAKKLQAQGCRILWLGARGRMEEKLVPAHGFEIAYIEVSGIRRNGLKRKLSAPFMIARAVFEAWKVLRDFKPDAVLGMGGYASGPGGLAAFLMHIPLVIHEQNAAAGLTNKLLSKLATKILLGFPGAFSGAKTEVVGNPVRSEIAQLHELKRNFNLPKLNILIVGGSLGAQALNTAVPPALAALGTPVNIRHQCGAGHRAAVQAAYDKAKVPAVVSDFIDDMAEAYSWAHLIICRAGALTAAETAAAALPALFIPLPTAVDDHQTKNALAAVQAGAAKLLPQSELSTQKLSFILNQCLADRAGLAKMSRAAAEIAILDAADRVAEILLKIKV